MVMDWDRSGDDAGAASWRGRMFALAGTRGMTATMVSGTGRAVPHDERGDAFAAWLAHVDAGRIGEGVR